MRLTGPGKNAHINNGQGVVGNSPFDVEAPFHDACVKLAQKELPQGQLFWIFGQGTTDWNGITAVFKLVNVASCEIAPQN